MDKSIIEKAVFTEGFVNLNAKLPYGLTAFEVANAIQETCTLLFDVNNFLVGRNLHRLEDMLLGNALSGMVSEIVVRNLAKNSKTLTRNERIGGHPDLILKGKYPSSAVLRANDGIEVKVSKQPGGWQGHNPEDVWLMVFRYTLGAPGSDPRERKPITFVQVLAAEIKKEDWSFSGRKGESRRTITASITEKGMDKLRSNPVYQNPAYIVAPSAKLKKKYEKIQARFK